MNIGKIPSTDFTKLLDNKMREYNAYLNDAYFVKTRNGGAPTKEEALIYQKAINTCNEIIEMCRNESAIVSKWRQFRDDANGKYSMIVAQLRAAVQKQSNSPSPVNPEKNAVKQSEGGSAEDNRSTAKTESGFVTRNASKEVPAEKIEKWFQPSPNYDFSDVIGMDELKEKLMGIAHKHKWVKTNKLLNILPLSSCLFYGPPGTGKTYVIEGFVSELMKDGFTYIKLEKADIHDAYVGVAEKIVQAAFREAIDHAPSVIYIDEFEAVSVDRGDDKAQGHEKRLTVALIEEYNTLKNAGKPIILLAATNHPEKIDSAWIDRFNQTGYILPFPLPSESQREKYFERKLSEIPFAEGLDNDTIVDKTDNYSYRDLDGLIGEISNAVLNKAKEKNTKYKEDGTINFEASDDAVFSSIENGEQTLSLEEFDEIRRSHPAAPKEEIIRSLHVYEDKVRSYQGE